MNSLDAEFKSYHLSVMDLIEDDALEGEQVVLDEHDDRIARLTVRVQQLASTVTQAVAAPSSSKGGVRLPKISVPTFDRNVVNWRSFCEHFRRETQSRSNRFSESDF